MIRNKSFFNNLNELGKKGQAFLFIIDFEGKKPVVFELDKLPKDICFETPVISYLSDNHDLLKRPLFKKHPIPYSDYKSKFDIVMSHIRNGDTYLINLTQPTKVDTDLNLKDIFHQSRAPYKLYFKDEFVVFSPESFIRINDKRIMTFPMKGTIDAQLPDAKETLLNDPKEISEHNTIVDLMRNDLSMVATKVNVDRFRYIEEIRTNEKNILQASSQISGILPDDYKNHIGDILTTLLPAGSISGAPKEKTMDILINTEGYSRSYYTGVFGIFDGENLDSAVMIRYVEKEGKNLIFKSGGGITFRSDPEKEYQELIDKVYVPIA